MNRNEIIEEIKRIAQENEGKAPGFQKLSNITGLRKADWYPNIWLRWGDALNEAGFDSNQQNVAYDISVLIKNYIQLIKDLGRFPISGEIRLQRKKDPDFPSHSSFDRMGSKQDRAKLIKDYCIQNNIESEIVKICDEIIKDSTNSIDSGNTENLTIGYVYLIKHGARNEYKIGKTFNPLRREGEIKLQLPEKITPIHYIETDDPSGIEAYWHNRFKTKRKEGEWFALNASDIRAFKRWKRII